MSFDFPNSPSSGQVFSPPGGPVYVYTGGVWRMQGSGQVVTAEARNRIVNPAMQISQENGSTGSAASAYYIADQWQTSWLTGAAAVGAVRSTTTSPNGTPYTLYTNVNTIKASVAATEFWTIAQPIEGTRLADFQWGTANAKQAVLRFSIKAPAGTWGVSLLNAAQDFSWVGEIVITAGQANTWTQQVFVIPAQTTGVWPITAAGGAYLYFSFAVGTNRQGAAGWNTGQKFGSAAISNGWGTAGNVFMFADVGLYLDPNATGVPPPWAMPDEAQELAACLRYYNKETTPTGRNFWVQTSDGTNRFYSSPTPVAMRTNPTVTGTSSPAGGTLGFGSIPTLWYAGLTGTTAAAVYSVASFALNARM